jgi:hypothetical protein
MTVKLILTITEVIFSLSGFGFLFLPELGMSNASNQEPPAKTPAISLEQMEGSIMRMLIGF